MMTSLDLDPEWGAIDLIGEIEAAFSIKITDPEAERCVTVGDIYALICTHTPDWDTAAGKCASSMTFYRIRRAVDPDRGQGISPRTPLETPNGAHQFFRQLAKETGLRFPATQMTTIGLIGGLLFTGGLLVSIVMLFTGAWIVSLAALAISIAGIPVMRKDRGLPPKGVSTIGDLVRRTAPLNSIELQNYGGRPADRWSILTALAAEHGALAPEEIRPETFLHQRSLKLATQAS